MKRLHFFSGILILCLFLAPALVIAQDEGGNGEPEPVRTDEETIPAAQEATSPPKEEPVRPGVSAAANINILPVEYRTGVIPFLVFWQNNMIFPENEVPWHDEVRRYLGMNDDEFNRSGFARHGEVWIPIAFLRRFQMMSNSYNHILVIKGRPASLPASKGISIGAYGTEISNDGFEVFMPTIASVSRQKKAQDERDALNLATFQLEQYGFHDIIWFADRTRIPGSVASDWAID